MSKKIIISRELLSEAVGSFNKQFELATEYVRILNSNQVKWKNEAYNYDNVVYDKQKWPSLLNDITIYPWLQKVTIGVLLKLGVKKNYSAKYFPDQFDDFIYIPFRYDMANNIVLDFNNGFYSGGTIALFAYSPNTEENDYKLNEFIAGWAIAHELGHIRDDLGKTMTDAKDKESKIIQDAIESGFFGNQIKINNINFDGYVKYDYKSEDNTKSLGYWNTKGPYQKIWNLKVYYDNRSKNPTNENIDANELKNISEFFTDVYRLDASEINAYSSTTNFDIRARYGKVELNKLQDKVTDTITYKMYKNILNRATNVYPKFSDIALNDMREQCTKNNIKLYNVNPPNNKTWITSISQAMAKKANEAMKRCAKNSMLAHYSEEDLADTENLPYKDPKSMTSQERNNMKQQIQNRRGQIQSPFSNNNI